MSSNDLKNPYTLVAEVLGCDPSSLDISSVLTEHPHWDSFNHLKLLMALEENYGINITDETLELYSKMKPIVEKHAELTAKSPL